MVCFNYVLCILGIFFCQMSLVYSTCRELDTPIGEISNTYIVRGASLYHRCWILVNSESNTLFIQLYNISLHNRPASSGVLTIKFLPESKVFNVSSQSQLRNFTTTSSSVEIHFKVNSSNFANGMITSFALQFSQDCTRILTELTGNLNSPNYPSKSAGGAECIYKIRLRPGYLINLTFYSVGIGYNEHCESKYIKVHDGDNQESPLIAHFCGTIASYPIISTHNFLWIKFKADDWGSKFYANYSALEIAYEDCNPKDSFRCAKNTCVPKIKVCDRIKDCENGADELGCVYNDCNDKNSFRCSDNTCISKSYVCNGIKNCRNGDDEIGCDPMVVMSTKVNGPKEVSEVITDDPKQNFQVSSTVDKLESGTGAHELRLCANGTTEVTKKDVLNMEVKEHRRRLEVIELQKRYEMDRIEFQRSFETERLKQMKQYHNFKTRVGTRGLDKDINEEESYTAHP